MPRALLPATVASLLRSGHSLRKPSPLKAAAISRRRTQANPTSTVKMPTVKLYTPAAGAKTVRGTAADAGMDAVDVDVARAAEAAIAVHAAAVVVAAAIAALTAKLTVVNPRAGRPARSFLLPLRCT